MRLAGMTPDKGWEMAETNINIVDALRGQQDQLKRLIARQVWISQAAKPTLVDMQGQVTEIKRLLDQLEVDIKGALQMRR